ncbi:hypothetical protein QFZ77_001478 [Paenibacillus sp. V4I3]|uniref:DUF3024 domain-containing protein n=1 Tax=Paenibacillus sp. V4I3 TaxID=3042305 RepID=UPI0027872565|nr:hypothetical protein [Paenibacillus sp. V4I3]MDQ0872819.1 hypothetical protein [Paenibacillus sp. V4I3]
MFDEFTKKRLENILQEYIGKKIPKHLNNQIRMVYKFRGNNVTLIEERERFIGTEWTQFDIAQFRFESNEWKLIRTIQECFGDNTAKAV